MHYKAPDNSLHFIEPEFAQLLPAGSVPITDAEAEALRTKPPVPTCQELRAPLYPPYQDYLDGIVKGDQAQIQKYIDDCLAVKALIPKD